MTNLYLRRIRAKGKSTIGFMYSSDRTVECFTLEDAHNDPKVYGETRIPAGRYSLVLLMSAHFNRQMVYLVAVPNYTGVMFHSGNTVQDTEGCIIVGDEPVLGATIDTIKTSSACLARIQPLITAMITAGDTQLTITDEDV